MSADDDTAMTATVLALASTVERLNNLVQAVTESMPAGDDLAALADRLSSEACDKFAALSDGDVAEHDLLLIKRSVALGVQQGVKSIAGELLVHLAVAGEIKS